MIGTEINGRYLIEGELGRGGMGVVYQGHDRVLKRPIAVKVVGPGVLGSEGRARLLREAQAAASLNHPHIVAVYDAGEAELPGLDGPAAFVVMELVAGQTLRDYSPADLAESVAILDQICQALQAAHDQGIIHRDLKPENVARSESGAIKLMDFGLARTGGRSRLTQEGTLIGTFDYLAPEIIHGQEASVQSDLYALGVMAYELLAGRRPFEADTAAAVLSQHLHAPPTPPSAFNNEIPPALEHLVIRLLSKRPEDRPMSAAAVRQQLTKPAATTAWDAADGERPHTLFGRPSPGAITGPRLDFLVRGRLIGRERELAEGMAVWRRAAAGQRQTLLISGEPGIGKTRLATEIGVQAQMGRGRLLQGQCYEHGGLPYMPLAQMIRSAMENGSAPDLSPEVLTNLGRIAPDLRMAEQMAKPDMAPGHVADEGQLFESFVALCKVLFERGPVLLFFDDLQWADSGTMGVIRHLARRLADGPLMIMVTYREIELAGKRPVQRLLDDLQRETGAVRLKLARLDRQQTQALLVTLFADEVTPEFLDAIYVETEGNPFFIEEICKALIESGELTFEDGHWQRPAMEHIRLPQSIQVTIENRLDQLAPQTLDALRAAAMLGREFRYDLLLVASELAETELVGALEEAMRAQLLREPEIVGAGGATDPSLSFSHALIQTTLLNGLGPLRRPLLARKQAKALEEWAKGQPGMAPLLGRLYSEAGDGEKAVPYLTEAGDEARRLFAYDEAIDRYEQALIFTREQGDPYRIARVLLTLGATHMKAGHFERSRRAFDEAFRLQRAGGRPRADRRRAMPTAQRPFRAHTSEPVTLDPTRATDTSSTFVTHQIFEGLVQRGPADEVLPAAAESWQIRDGGRRYIFQLRDDGAWSDGAPVTAHDFEFAWKRLFEPVVGRRIAPAFYDIRGGRRYIDGQTIEPDEIGVRALDKLTLEVALEQPVAYFLHVAAGENALPVPQHLVEAHGDKWTDLDKIATNGPFVPAKWEPGRELILERNHHFSGAAGGNLERVHFKLNNDASLLEDYAAGRLDCLYLSLLSTPIVGLALRRFGEDLISLPSIATGYVAFNCSRPPFDDRRVRQAMSLAIDRSRLTEETVLGLNEPAMRGFIPPGIAGHGLGPEAIYDLARARQLLAEAGYPDGNGFPEVDLLEVAPAGDTSSSGTWIHRRLAEDLDLRLRLRQLTMAQMIDYQESRERRFWFLGWSVDYTDPDAILRAGNWPDECQWENEHFVQVVEAARLETNHEARMALYQQAEHLLAEEAPLIPMTHGRSHILVKPWVERFATSAPVWTIFRDVILEA